MKKIVVLQRGWVIVGDFTQDGAQCTVKNGAVIRRWGTTKGLGELAVEGPRSGTVLDPIPDAHFHELTVVLAITCGDAWTRT